MLISGTGTMLRVFFSITRFPIVCSSVQAKGYIPRVHHWGGVRTWLCRVPIFHPGDNSMVHRSHHLLHPRCWTSKQWNWRWSGRLSSCHRSLDPVLRIVFSIPDPHCAPWVSRWSGSNLRWCYGRDCEGMHLSLSFSYELTTNVRLWGNSSNTPRWMCSHRSRTFR